MGCGFKLACALLIIVPAFAFALAVYDRDYVEKEEHSGKVTGRFTRTTCVEGQGCTTTYYIVLDNSTTREVTWERYGIYTTPDGATYTYVTRSELVPFLPASPPWLGFVAVALFTMTAAGASCRFGRQAKAKRTDDEDGEEDDEEVKGREEDGEKKPGGGEATDGELIEAGKKAEEELPATPPPLLVERVVERDSHSSEWLRKQSEERRSRRNREEGDEW